MKTEKATVTWEFHENGRIYCERYLLNGEVYNYHNPIGPAYREWYENGQIRFESYYLNGHRHNPNGSAYTEFRGKNGEISREEYWINGNNLTKEQFVNRNKKDTCDGKIVEIEGRKYRLTSID